MISTRHQLTVWVGSVTIALPILLGVLGCEGGAQPPTREEILNLFPRPLSASTASQIRKIEIHIDASVPMQNFVRRSTREAETGYSQLLEYMSANPWNADRVDYFSFGETTRKPIASPTARGLTFPAENRNFYDQRTSHVGELIAEFVRDFDRQCQEGIVRFVVTDFVQANIPDEQEASTSNWAFVANQIRAYRVRFGGWQLLALRGDYCGRHFAEADKVNFEVSSSVRRPFYVLVFAPNNFLAEEAASHLLEGFDIGDWRREAQRFNPERLMGRAKWIDKTVPAQFGASSERRNMFNAQSPLYKNSILELNWNSISDPTSEAFVAMDLAFEIDDPGDCFIDLGRLSTSSQLACIDWQGKNTVGDSAQYKLLELSAEDFEFRLVPAPEDSLPSQFRRLFRAELLLRPHKQMRSGGHYIYRIDLRYERRRLQLPKWVGEWSCDNDADPSLITRTMNLKHILNAVMLNSNDDIPVFSGFLSVQGR